jgi:hypothetical protein
MPPEGGRARRRQAIRPPPHLGFEGRDEAAPLETGEGGVEGSRSDPLARRRLDVGHDRVAVLRPAAQGEEDRDRRLGEASEIIEARAGHWRTLRSIAHRYSVSRYTSDRPSSTAGRAGSASARRGYNPER